MIRIRLSLWSIISCPPMSERNVRIGTDTLTEVLPRRVDLLAEKGCVGDQCHLYHRLGKRAEAVKSTGYKYICGGIG